MAYLPTFLLASLHITSYLGDFITNFSGSIIDLNVVLTAHHKGHFEFRACPLPWDGNGNSALAIPEGGIPNQACFDAHPLTFIEDVLSLDETRAKANFDPHYPERAYIPLNDSNLSYKFELPAGLSGDLVLIQWYYVTGNSCMDEGYDTYNWPVGFHPGNIPICTVIPPDGRGTPEQVRIVFEWGVCDV